MAYCRTHPAEVTATADVFAPVVGAAVLQESVTVERDGFASVVGTGDAMHCSCVGTRRHKGSSRPSPLRRARDLFTAPNPGRDPTEAAYRAPYRRALPGCCDVEQTASATPATASIPSRASAAVREGHLGTCPASRNGTVARRVKVICWVSRCPAAPAFWSIAT